MASAFPRRAHGLPRRMRLARKRDFERAYAEGARARGAILAVVVRANGLGFPRFGLSIGRAIWKSAVRRNRVRRVFREAFRLSRAELPDVDIVLMAARPGLEPVLAETQAELVRLVAQAARRLREREAAARRDASPAERAAADAPRRRAAEEP
jgi:ribonuclease P protein component